MSLVFLLKKSIFTVPSFSTLFFKRTKNFENQVGEKTLEKQNALRGSLNNNLM